MKKQYTAPVFSMVYVSNDIVTASVTLNPNRGFNSGEQVGAPQRRSIWD